MRLDFEVCSPSSAFTRRLQEYEAIYAKNGDDDGVRIDGLDIVHSDKGDSFIVRLYRDKSVALHFKCSARREIKY